MSAPLVLAIDAMSGDHGHRVVVEASLLAIDEHANLNLILVGDESLLRKTLAGHRRASAPRIAIQHA